jgi:hypothetical protein
MLRHFALFVAVLACGCDPHNTQDACIDISHAYCERAFDLANQGCTTTADWLAGHGFASLNDCASAFTFMNGHTCANTTTNECAPDDFSGGRASQCASDLMKLPCDRDWDGSALSASSSCAFMCCVHAGNPGSGDECCSGQSHVESSGCGVGGTSICN